MSSGTWRNRSPGGHTLVVETSEHGGSYRIKAGSPWGLFGSSMRLVVVASCIGGLAALGAGRSRKVVTLGRRIGGRRIFFATVVAIVSGLIFYSTVHEFGHYIVAIMLGGEVREVAWTVLSGGEPHVSFKSMPEGAGPWMSAAGPILPTLVAVVMIAIWLVFSKRMAWYLSVCLVAPALMFLFANVGCVFELFDSGTHMNRLSSHLGLQGIVRVVFELLPLFVSLVMFGLVGCRIREMMKNGEAQ
ncbi:MAG: M50 family metallopeptidase [Phycisphaerae bacterium]|nr:M50 family metallopeptidase [Phycisphaerae bacterium]